MASPSDAEENIFEALKRVDPAKDAAREKEAAERFQTQIRIAQERLGILIGSNSTLPVTINSIHFIGGKNTRRSFLDRLFDTLLSANRDRPYTLSEALHEVGNVATKLQRFGIFKEPISTFIGRPDPTNASSTPTDIDIFINAAERGRISAKTGVDVGNAEGSGYTNIQLRNIFGGAESLDLNASKGTATRSSYQAVFGTPILSDPSKRISVDVLASSVYKPWASHEEAIKGAGLKYNWATKSGTSHQVGYSAAWRQISRLAENASPTVRNDAGDSFKSSISHTWHVDRRNHPFLPSRGYQLKTISEIAGWGPLTGDVAFWKSELHTSGVVPIPIPGIKGDSGVTLTGGFRAGMLYPLPIGLGSESKPSRLNDRFQLGGITDVRGFAMSGLGPHDGADAVGGDLYYAASTNLLMPVPGIGRHHPLRFQVFANAGRLVGLKDSKGKGRAEDSKTQQRDFYASVAQLGDGIPSVSVGLGLVYAHELFRLEGNFGVPIVLRRGEVARKGFQVGLGVEFL